MSGLQFMMVEGDCRDRITEIARRFGWEASGQTWPEEEIPDDVDIDARGWLVTWFVQGWTALSSPDGNDAGIDDVSVARKLSAELGTRVALAGYESVSGLETLELFRAGELVRAFRCYGGEFPTEQEGEPLCRSSGVDPEDANAFAEGTLFNALDALLGFSNDDFLFFEPKTSFAVRRSATDDDD